MIFAFFCWTFFLITFLSGCTYSITITRHLRGGIGIANYQELTGTVIGMNDIAVGPYREVGCYKLMSLDLGYGTIVNFVLAPNTYFLNHKLISVGDRVSGFYDLNTAAPIGNQANHLARVVSEYKSNRIVKVDYFNNQLVSSGGFLQINIGPNTNITMQNGQSFTGDIANRELVVVYSEASIGMPSQTTPS